jgi:hypothetical protein
MAIRYGSQCSTSKICSRYLDIQARLKSANLGIDPGLMPGLLRIDPARSWLNPGSILD